MFHTYRYLYGYMLLICLWQGILLVFTLIPWYSTSTTHTTFQNIEKKYIYIFIPVEHLVLEDLAGILEGF